MKIGGQYLLEEEGLLEWANVNKISLPSGLFSDPGLPETSLADAIKAGGIHYEVEGTGKESVLKAVLDLIPLPGNMDKSVLFQVLMARESAGSTGIGDGIAIPHVRSPIVMKVPKPIISLCFLKKPIEYKALDGKPVGVIFMMVCPSIPSHLGLLSKLAYALRKTGFSEAVDQKWDPDEIIARAAEIDQAIRDSSGSQGEIVK